MALYNVTRTRLNDINQSDSVHNVTLLYILLRYLHNVTLLYIMLRYCT